MPAPREAFGSIRDNYGPGSRAPAVGLEQRENTVRVWFGVGWEDAARALTETFGAVVMPTVGFGGDSSLSSPDVPLPVAEIHHETLELRCEPSASAVSRGQAVTAEITIENCGKTELQTIASADLGLLCDPHSGLIVGSYRGWTTGTTDVLRLSPRETRFLTIVVETDAAGNQPDGAVEPGKYDVIAPVALTAYPLVRQPRSIRWVLARGSIEVT